jgi:hypothetical protein
MFLVSMTMITVPVFLVIRRLSSDTLATTPSVM